MAVARPVRFLGALSIVLIFFLLFQYFRNPPTLSPPGFNIRHGEKIEDMERDPLLDGTDMLASVAARANIQQQSAIPTNRFGDTPSMTILPTVPTRHELMPPSSPSSEMKNSPTSSRP